MIRSLPTFSGLQSTITILAEDQGLATILEVRWWTILSLSHHHGSGYETADVVLDLSWSCRIGEGDTNDGAHHRWLDWVYSCLHQQNLGIRYLQLTH